MTSRKTSTSRTGACPNAGNAKGRCPKTPAQRLLKGGGIRATHRSRPSSRRSRCAPPWNGRKFAVPRTGTSMLADTIVHVEKVLLQGPERPSGNRRTTLPRQSRRGLLKGLRHAQTRKGAARRPRGLADGGHRHQPRSRDASHRGRHRGAVTHGIRDQRTQPPITAPRPVRASTPGRAFS